MEYGEWLDAVITTADDDDLTAEVNLGMPYDTILIHVPTITTGTLAVQVSTESGGTFADLSLTDADGSDAPVVADSGTGGFYWRVPCGFQFIKLKTGASQGDDRTFKVRGIQAV